MQFIKTEKAGTNFCLVQFGEFNIPWKVISILQEAFNKLGGELTDVKNQYKFPSFITSEVIQQVIKNTCFVCGGLMQDNDSNGLANRALENTWIGSEDFGGDYGQSGTTWSKIGQPVMRIVRKCSSCGHSHT